jgi:hypothetical protein
MNKEQLQQRIEEVCGEFKGQIPDLYQMVGILVVGRLYGWRVVRLTCSSRVWALTNKWFGDPKEMMPERGPLHKKSVGLKVVDGACDYWDFIRGTVARKDYMTEETRKSLI